MTNDSAHLSGEHFKLQAGVEAQHVPYNQFPQGIADLVAGRIQFMFLTSSVSVPLVQSGKVRGLAVTGGQRLEQLPSIPTMMELGYKDFLVRGWDGTPLVTSPNEFGDLIASEVDRWTKVVRDAQIKPD